jgi:hypothetical protein
MPSAVAFALPRTLPCTEPDLARGERLEARVNHTRELPSSSERGAVPPSVAQQDQATRMTYVLLHRLSVRARHDASPKFADHVDAIKSRIESLSSSIVEKLHQIDQRNDLLRASVGMRGMDGSLYNVVVLKEVGDLKRSVEADRTSLSDSLYEGRVLLNRPQLQRLLQRALP